MDSESSLIPTTLQDLPQRPGFPFLRRARRPRARKIKRGAGAWVLLGLLCLPGAPAWAHGPVHEQVAAVSRAIEQSPRDPQLYLKRGELYRLEQHYDLALADFETARQFAATNLPALDLALGRLYLEAGWPHAAQVILDRFLEPQPRHARALTLRAQAWRALSRPLAAAADYSRAIACASQPDPDLFVQRAQCLVAAGEDHWESALRGLDEGIRKLGPLVTLQLPAIEIELKRNHYNAALRRLDTLAAQSPRQETWLKRRGDILRQAGREAEARQAYRQALQALRSLPPARRAVPAMVELEQSLLSHLPSEKSTPNSDSK